MSAKKNALTCNATNGEFTCRHELGHDADQPSRGHESAVVIWEEVMPDVEDVVGEVSDVR